MNTRKYSNEQEKTVAKNLKGKKVINSGATKYAKGDVSTKNFLIECKTAVTEKESFSIKKEWITEIKEEAFAMNKEKWAIVFNFGGLENKENYYIISEKDFKSYKNHVEAIENE